MLECCDCGNIYLNPRPTAQELAVIYPPDYYAYSYETTIHPIALKAKNLLDSLKVRRWLSYLAVPVQELQFLDVGCGNGRYLRMLEEMGARRERLWGVELSGDEIAKLNDNGFHGHLGTIEEVAGSLPEGSFDLIVLLQVLEHVPDPARVIELVSRLLAPGGVLIIETPNTESLDGSIFRSQYWGGYHFPRHWNLFSERTLERLAVQGQLEVKAFNYLPAHSFWIFSIHHYLLDRARMPVLAKFFNPHRNIFLLAIFTSFDILRAWLGFKTSNLQMVAQKRSGQHSAVPSEG
jgi:SAM-dependent methyltransferase